MRVWWTSAGIVIVAALSTALVHTQRATSTGRAAGAFLQSGASFTDFGRPLFMPLWTVLVPLVAACEELGTQGGSLARLLTTQVQCAIALGRAGGGPREQPLGGGRDDLAPRGADLRPRRTSGRASGPARPLTPAGSPSTGGASGRVEAFVRAERAPRDGRPGPASRDRGRYAVVRRSGASARRWHGSDARSDRTARIIGSEASSPRGQ